MAWLVVLGHGSWARRNPQGRLERYKAGVHEVDDETAAAARKASAKVRSLVVLDHEPRLEPDRTGPISREDLENGRNWGVRLALAPGEETALPERGDDDYDFECRLCPPGKSRYASAGRLARHVEFHHSS